MPRIGTLLKLADDMICTVHERLKRIAGPKVPAAQGTLEVRHSRRGIESKTTDFNSSRSLY